MSVGHRGIEPRSLDYKSNASPPCVQPRWRPQRESNPHRHRDGMASWPLDDGTVKTWNRGDSNSNHLHAVQESCRWTTTPEKRTANVVDSGRIRTDIPSMRARDSAIELRTHVMPRVPGGAGRSRTANRVFRRHLLIQLSFGPRREGPEKAEPRLVGRGSGSGAQSDCHLILDTRRRSPSRSAVYHPARPCRRSQLRPRTATRGRFWSWLWRHGWW